MTVPKNSAFVKLIETPEKITKSFKAKGSKKYQLIFFYSQFFRGDFED